MFSMTDNIDDKVLNLENYLTEHHFINDQTNLWSISKSIHDR